MFDIVTVTAHDILSDNAKNQKNYLKTNPNQNLMAFIVITCCTY